MISVRATNISLGGVLSFPLTILVSLSFQSMQAPKGAHQSREGLTFHRPEFHKLPYDSAPTCDFDSSRDVRVDWKENTISHHKDFQGLPRVG